MKAVFEALTPDRFDLLFPRAVALFYLIDVLVAVPSGPYRSRPSTGMTCVTGGEPSSRRAGMPMPRRPIAAEPCAAPDAPASASASEQRVRPPSARVQP